MNIILGDRRSGKTTALINRALELRANGELAYIVCHNHNAAYHLNEYAESINKSIQFPLTIREIVSNQHGGATRLLVDEAQFLFQQFSPVIIDTVSITLDNSVEILKYDNSL